MYDAKLETVHDLSDLTKYKEFDIAVPEREKVPDSPGVPMSHQILIANFMKGFTNVESMLLVHDMGTGKTCTAINSIEKNINDVKYGMKKALILNRGKAIMNNFINELVNKCTTVYNTGSERSSKNLWSKYYTFDTFEIFSKKIKDMSDYEIAQKYNNTFMVIDEVHNILNDESEIYTQIERFIRVVPNKKVLLLSGTPVRDVPENFAPIMNLILKPDEKLETDPREFKKLYYDANGEINTIFKNKLVGKVSFLAASLPEIKVEYAGAPVKKLTAFRVVVHKMSKFQKTVYEKAYLKDATSGGVYTNSRQASRFVFPDGTYGSEGFSNYVVDKKFYFKAAMRNDLKKYGEDRASVLRRISELSSKYAYIIEKIIDADSKGEKTIVYDDLVKGSGLIVFGLLLDFVGFKKYRLLSSETATTAQISKIQKEFNSSVTGEKISVILGSKVIAEGFTFLDVSHEHLVPHWNNTETMQVVARGIRLGSHSGLLKIDPNAKVTVYRHIAVAGENYELSIDYIMTKLSESKELEINKVIDAIKEVAISCVAFSRRNGGNCGYFKSPAVVTDNLISSGDIDPKIVNKIKKYFLNKPSAAISDTAEALKISEDELVKYVFYFISEKVQIFNSKGIFCWLNCSGKILFLSETVDSDGDPYSAPYSFDVFPQTSFTKAQNYKNAIDVELQNDDSPDSLQRLIELAVTVKFANLTSTRNEKINEILDSFSDKWMIDDVAKKAYVWYLADFSKDKNVVPACLDNPKSKEPWKEWRPCTRREISDLENVIESEGAKFEENLRAANVTHYGLWNPNIEEFCIKKVGEIEKTGDKRKIASGKRCINWNKNILVELARDEIKMEGRNWKDWAKQNREYMCEDIRKWFGDRKLLVNNSSCGVQTKRKA